MLKGWGGAELAAIGGELKGTAPSLGASGVVGRGVGSNEATVGTMGAGERSGICGMGGIGIAAKGEAPGSPAGWGGGDAAAKNPCGCAGGIEKGDVCIDGAGDWAGGANEGAANGEGMSALAGLAKGLPWGGMAAKPPAASSGSVTGVAAPESKEVMPGPACIEGCIAWGMPKGDGMGGGGLPSRIGGGASGCWKVKGFAPCGGDWKEKGLAAACSSPPGNCNDGLAPNSPGAGRGGGIPAGLRGGSAPAGRIPPVGGFEEGFPCPKGCDE